MSALQDKELHRVDSEDKPRLCPLLAINRTELCYCMEDLCGWWHRRYPHPDGCCALNAIATSLDEIDADLCT